MRASRKPAAESSLPKSRFTTSSTAIVFSIISQCSMIIDIEQAKSRKINKEQPLNPLWKVRNVVRGIYDLRVGPNNMFHLCKSFPKAIKDNRLVEAITTAQSETIRLKSHG